MGSPFADTVTLIEVPPTIANQTFRLDEGSPAGSAVGLVAASDIDPTRVLTYAITGGNTGGAFQIGSASGQLTVASAVPLVYATNPAFTLTVRVSDDLGQSSSATVTVRLNSAGSSLNVSGVQATSGLNALVDTTSRLPGSNSSGLGASNSFVGDSPSVAAATGAGTTAAGNLFALLNPQGNSNPLFGVTSLIGLTPLFELHGGNLNPWFVIGSAPVLPVDSAGTTNSTLHRAGTDSNGAFTLDETFQDSYTISRNAGAGTYTLDEIVTVFSYDLLHPTVAGNGSSYAGSDNLTLHATGTYTSSSFTVATLTLHENGTENSHIDQVGPPPAGSTSGSTGLHVDSNDTFVLDGTGTGPVLASVTLDKTGTESFQLTESGQSSWHTADALGSTTDGTASFGLTSQGLDSFHQNQQQQMQSGTLLTTSFTAPRRRQRHLHHESTRHERSPCRA